MRRIGWVVALILVALILVASPGRAADRKLTVQELKDRVAAARGANMGDAELAKELSGMELSEELPASEVGRLAELLLARFRPSSFMCWRRGTPRFRGRQRMYPP